MNLNTQTDAVQRTGMWEMGKKSDKHLFSLVYS